MNNWDVIVVGAGCGGLTAAAAAAKEGKRVLLLERHNVPGGFATSFVRGRFEFEASLHQLCSFGTSEKSGSTRDILEKLGVASAVKWVDIPGAYRLITTGSGGEPIDAVMPFGVEAYIAKMEQYVPGSRPSMERLFALAEEIVNTTGFMSSLDGKYDLKAINAILKEHMNFLRTAPYCVNDVLDALAVPKKAQDIFCAYWMYLGAPSDTLSFIHYISMVYSYLTLGAVAPKHRSHDLSLALAHCVEENGGEVRYNSHVTRILTSKGSVSGVKLADGTIHKAKAVICGISPTTVYSKMINFEDVPKSCIQLTNARKFSARGLCMYLGLNRSYDELGITDHSLFICDTADSRKQFDLMGKLDSNNAQAVVCYNVADNTCSPKGTTIMCFTSYYTSDCFSEVSPEEYFNVKQRIAQRFVDNYEKATGIAIREHIEEIELATPVTYAHYTDAPQGAIYGYYADDWDGVVARTMCKEQDRSVNGLYFCGGWGKMLSGYSSSISSGFEAAQDALAGDAAVQPEPEPEASAAAQPEPTPEPEPVQENTEVAGDE